MRAIELFAGCGGAALGIADAGLEHAGCWEIDADAVATLLEVGLPGRHADVSKLCASTIPSARLWWASPPCQAWSQAGRRLGANDPRNGWPWVFRLLKEAAGAPDVFIAENVRGMIQHKRKAECGHGANPKPLECPGCYFNHVVVATARQLFGHVDHRVLNAADFGVPQKRNRVFLVGRNAPVQWPSPTHSGEALAAAKFRTGTYAKDRGLEPADIGEPSKAEARWLKRWDAGDRGGRFGLLPWVTVYDALGLMLRCIGAGRNPQRAGVERTYRDITHEPAPVVAATEVGNRGPWLVDQASGDYARHPASGLHEPSNAIRASDAGQYRRERWRKGEHPELLHAPSATVSATEYKGTNGKESTGWTAQGGPSRASDTAWLATGIRRLTVQECLVLQGFPADHPIQGKTKRSRYMQVGNAVPPALAEALVTANLDGAGAETPAQLRLF